MAKVTTGGMTVTDFLNDKIQIRPDELDPIPVEFVRKDANRTYIFPRFFHQYLKRVINDWPEFPLMLLEKYVSAGIFTCSNNMYPVFLTIEAAKESEEPVLICGESGSGKEMIAAYIAGGKKEDIVIRNCAAFNEGTIVSELFGHKKGVATGLTYDKPGIFEDKHVVFLDEIDKLSMQAQGMLLRAIEYKETLRLGEPKPKTAKYKKIILSTNQKLDKLVSEGKFLRDLYYRIYTNLIQLPTLQERGPLEIEMLTHLFIITDLMSDSEDYRKSYSKLLDHEKTIDQYNNRMDDDYLEVSKRSIVPYLLNYLSYHAFDGSIRRLRNEVLRIVAYAKALRNLWREYDNIDINAIMETPRPGISRSGYIGKYYGVKGHIQTASSVLLHIPQNKSDNPVEQASVNEFIRICNQANNVDEASKLLKIARSTVYSKIKRSQIGNQIRWFKQ